MKIWARLRRRLQWESSWGCACVIEATRPFYMLLPTFGYLLLLRGRGQGYFNSLTHRQRIIPAGENAWDLRKEEEKNEIRICVSALPLILSCSDILVPTPPGVTL